MGQALGSLGAFLREFHCSQVNWTLMKRVSTTGDPNVMDTLVATGWIERDPFAGSGNVTATAEGVLEGPDTGTVAATA